MSRRMEGARCSPTLRVSSGLASPEAEELQVALSPPGGIYPLNRLNQGCGVPALLAHRDLPALVPSPPTPRREEGREGGDRSASTPARTSPAEDRPTDRQTDRPTEGCSSPGSQTRRTRRRDPAGGGGLGAGRVEEGEETDPPSRCDTGVTESPAGSSDRGREKEPGVC